MKSRSNFKHVFRNITAWVLLLAFITGIMLSGIQSQVQAATGIPTYLDPRQPVESRVSDLLSRMTLDEKVGQMLQPEKGSISVDDVRSFYLGSVLSGGGSFPGSGTEEDSTLEKWTELYNSMQDAALSTRLGIPLLYGVDAVHGHSNVKGATIFPHNIGLGATRDSELIKRIGAAVASEVKATGINWTFAPTIADPQNIKWGRTYEGFGENLDLVAEMGVAYTQGLQGDTLSSLKDSDKVVATLKHFLGEGWTDNGTNQGNVTSMTKEQVAEQLIKPYADAVAAGARSVMVSYNSIGGVKCHASEYLISDVLKEQLGFDGIVITDYNGIEQINRDESGNPVSGLKAQLKVGINAGIDMLMETGNWRNCYNYIKELVQDEIDAPGTGIPMTRIDDAVSRILRVKFQAGVFENPKADPSMAAYFGSEANREIAREAVRKSLVLLKNDEVDGTPILSKLKDYNNIFVAGRNADNLGNQSGGWTITWQGKSGNTLTEGTTILQGIRNTLEGSGKTVTYNMNGRVPEGSEVAIVVVGETPYAEGNGDTSNLELSSDDKATLENVMQANIPTIVILVSGRPMIINDYLDEWDGLIAAWLPGSEGHGVADVLFGDYDFTGKLPIKWPFYLEALPITESDSPYILFNYGYGLAKDETTPILPAIPEKPSAGLPADVTAVSIPGLVEAENPFAVGGWDIAAPGNNFIESGEGRSGGKNIGWTSSGKWLRYAIDVQTAGWYKVELGLASPGGASNAIQLKDANGNILVTASAPDTGAWASFAPSDYYVELTRGAQVIEFYCAGGNFNFDYMEFFKVDAPPSPPVLPGFEQTASVVEGGADAVESWMSTERMPENGKWYWKEQYTGEEKKLEKQDNIDITALDDADIATINVDPSQQYQTMRGIGTSFEGSSIYNLSKMSNAKREEVLRALVDPEQGIGMSMIRLTIGTADFTSGEFYTYDDMPAGETDEDLSEFSIEKDEEEGKNIVKAAQDARDIAADYGVDLKFFASPWSPPGWMKTTDSMIKGQVKDEYLDELAKYYLKYLKAYKEKGINIEAMTLQNEPLLEIEYPSTKMPWQQEAQLAKLLRAEIDAYNLTVDEEDQLHVDLWIFDHNPGDTMAYPVQILKDNDIGAYDAVDGTAFHDYGGDLGEMTKLHNMYPEKEIYLTERAVWGTTGADRMAQYFRNWATGYNSWVFMLDSDISTHRWVGTPGPTPIIQDASNPDNYWMLPEVYLAGQYSKFVKPGDIRIYSNYGSSETVTNVAFLNPETGKVTLVVINRTATQQPFKVVCKGTQFGDTLPAKTVATYVWTPIQGETEEPVAEISDNVDYEETSVILLHAGADAESVTGWTPDDGKLKSGTSGVSSADYTITVPEEGDYAIDIRYAGSGGTRSFRLDYGEGSSVDFEDCAATASWEEWFNKSVRQVIHLEAGQQTVTLKLTEQEVWTDVVSLTFTKLETLDAPLKIDAVQALSYSNLAIGPITDSGSGYGFGNTSPESSMSYEVNIPVAGKYDISYRVASGTSNSKLRLEIVGTEATTPDAIVTTPDAIVTTSDSIVLDPISIPNTGWNTYETVTHTVDLPAGTVNLKIVCDTSGFNFNWFSIAFHDVTEPASTVIIKDINFDFISKHSSWGYNSEGTRLTDVQEGYWGDYVIDIPETGDYYINVKYTGEDYGHDPGRQFSILEGETVLGTASVLRTGGWNPWNYKSEQFKASFTQGEHTIRLQIDHGYWMDFDTITIVKVNSYTAPAEIDAIQALNYNSAAIGTGGFENTSAGSWFEYEVNVNKSQNYDITYNVATGNDDAKIKLLINADESISPDAAAVPKTDWSDFTTVTDTIFLPAGTNTLRIFCDTNGFNFNGFSIVTAAVQPEVRAELGYSFEGRIINLTINRALFNKSNIHDITVNGDSFAVSWLDPTHARIKLGFDYEIGDGETITVAVPTTAYTGFEGGSDLEATVTVSNPVNNVDPIEIPGRINAEEYYQMDGITVGNCTLGGKQVQVGASGGWTDYLVSVPSDGEYTLNLKINPLSAISGSLMLMEGTDVLTYFNSPSVDSKWVDLRRTITLSEGEHHLKLFATAGSFNINYIDIQPLTAQSISDVIEAESYINTDQVPVEGENNLGYTVAGNYFDYYIDVPETGDYTVTYRYATAQSACSVSFVKDGTELSRTILPSTGGWANYVNATGAVHLAAGIYTIRLIDNGDGFNLDYITFTEGSEGVVTQQEKAAVPVLSLKGGTYNGNRQVTITSATPGAQFYYTLDGTLPTVSSSRTNGTITLTRTSVLRVIAAKSGMSDSYVASATYIITGGTNDSDDSEHSDRPSTPKPTPAPTPTPVPVPSNMPVDVAVPAPVLDIESGAAAVKVDAAALSKAFTESNIVNVTVQPIEGASSYVVQLPADALSSESAQNRIEVQTELGTIVAPGNMLTTTEVTGAQNVNLSIGKADTTVLPADVAAAIGHRPVIELRLTVDGAVKSWNNPDAPVTIQVPYTPAKEELTHPDHIVVWYIDGAGKVVAVPNGRFDPATGTVRFTTTHFSKYAVGFVRKTFSDAADYAWAQKAIEVMVSRGVISGTSATTFSPAAKITRADFMYILMRALGLSAKVDSNFSDISPSIYYYDAVGAAKKLGITSGTGNNKFDPDALITRQEMMTFVVRAMKLANKNLEAGNVSDLSKYSDSSKIASYAAESIAALVRNGIVVGSGTTISPTAVSTRAEAVVIIYKISSK